MRPPYTFITTLGRVGDQVTLRQVPWATLVVQAHEFVAYSLAYPDNDVVALPVGITTLGPTRKWCLENLASEYGKIILLDDDLTISFRNTPGDYHLKVATPEQVEALFDSVSNLLDGYAHVSVSGREGQNRMSPEESLPLANGRYMRFLAYNVTLFPPGIEVGRVDGMSDFDLNLQLLRSGQESRLITRWAQGHRGTQAPGGCTEQRTQDKHTAEVMFMAETHAPFVTAVDKVNKTGGDFGTRKEVRVQWKKAFESSQVNTSSGPGEVT